MAKFLNLAGIGRRALLSWLAMALLVGLVCMLAVLQYRWIGEISQANQKKLQDQLQSSLNKLSRDFNAELDTAFNALEPTEAEVMELGREQAYTNHYAAWKNSTARPKLFMRVAIAWEENGQPVLRIVNQEDGTFARADWPERWNAMKEFIALRGRGGAGRGQGGRRGPNGPGGFARALPDQTLIDLPRFTDAGGNQGGEQDWLLARVDPNYAAAVLLPELMARYLGADYLSEYRVETSVVDDPSTLIYPLDAKEGEHTVDTPDASVSLLERNPARRGFGPGPRPRPGATATGSPTSGKAGEPVDTGRGRWQLSVQHRAGSLEAVVARTRWKNLGVSAGILLLLVVTAASLLRLSRQAQRLADVEMEFVAGVSHELRTPLTVIRTAAFNLRGKIVTNPSQVERYGTLIQQESEKLTAIVEQVLTFASAKAGRAIRERQPVAIESLIENSLQASKGILDESQCRVEAQIEPGLPLIVGDSMSLQHALQNLISNAVKYGSAENRWIGIFARTVAGRRGPAVEVRVSDRGAGISPDEQRHLFDAFFRGEKAVRDQIHGTGLGLNLVKKIVEAHGGTVSVESEPGAGASFIVTLPAGPAENRDELAHSLG